MGIFNWGWLQGQYFSSLDPSTRRVLYYNVYILYYTLLYQNQFIYFTTLYNITLQYYTMYCKNTKYTVYPRLFLLQLLCFCPSGSLYSSNRVFGWFYSAPCHDLGQKNIRTANLGQSVCHSLQVWGNCKEFNFTFTFKIQLANERLDKWHFIQEGDGKYLDLQKKNLLSNPGKQIFCLFWIECNIFPTIAQSKYNRFYLEI